MEGDIADNDAHVKPALASIILFSFVRTVE